MSQSLFRAMRHLIDLRTTIAALDEIEELKDVADAIREEMSQLVLGDEAYRDAAARLIIGEEPPPLVALSITRIRESLPEELRKTDVPALQAAFIKVLNALQVEPDDIEERWDEIISYVAGELTPLPERFTTHYVHRNSAGSIFVKEAKFFEEQGGHTAPWGKNWRPVIAGSIEEARRMGADIDWNETADNFLADAGTDAAKWAREWMRIYRTLIATPDEVDEGWMIGWFANAFEAQRQADMKKDSEPFKAGYEAGRHDYHLEYVQGVLPTESLAKRLHQLDEVTKVATDPGNAYADEYMRGMANGLILAQATVNGKEPAYLESVGTPQAGNKLDAVIRALRDWLITKRDKKLPSTAAALRDAAVKLFDNGVPTFQYALYGTHFNNDAISQARVVVCNGEVIKDNARVIADVPDDSTGIMRKSIADVLDHDLGKVTETRKTSEGSRFVGKRVPAEGVKDTSKLAALEEAAREWYGEMVFQNHGVHEDGTPKMGKFETEELFRAIGRYFGINSRTGN